MPSNSDKCQQTQKVGVYEIKHIMAMLQQLKKNDKGFVQEKASYLGSRFPPNARFIFITPVWLGKAMERING